MATLGDGWYASGLETMANNDPRRRIFGRPALLLLATGGIITVSLWAGTRCLSQGWSGDGMPEYGGGAGMPGHGGGVGGPGQMGMGYSDQQFIVMMIPHHDGAIAMADLALTRAKRPEIKALAKSIKASQTARTPRCATGIGSGTARMYRTGDWEQAGAGRTAWEWAWAWEGWVGAPWAGGRTSLP